MILRVNEKEIEVKAIFGDTVKQGTYTYPALRFEFKEGGVTDEEIQELLSGTIEIVDESSGEVIGTHSGYNTLKNVSVTIGKITTTDQKIEELEAALAAAQQEKADLEASLNDAKSANEELQDALDIVVGGNV